MAFLDRVAASLDAGVEPSLELGSGTGDDARYLAGRGLAVQPSDGATSFVEAMRRAGLSSLRIDVLADDLGGPWDAVVAFAMLLHLTPDELATALDRIHGAVQPRGTLALSVKEGDGSAWSDHKLGLPRFFTYWRPDRSLGCWTSTVGPWTSWSDMPVPGTTGSSSSPRGATTTAVRLNR